MASSYSKTTVFVRPHVKEKPAFSKIFTRESVFEKMPFRGPFSPNACGRYAKTEEEKISFRYSKKKMDTYRRGLRMLTKTKKSVGLYNHSTILTMVKHEVLT